MLTVGPFCFGHLTRFPFPAPGCHAEAFAKVLPAWTFQPTEASPTASHRPFDTTRSLGQPLSNCLQDKRMLLVILPFGSKCSYVLGRLCEPFTRQFRIAHNRRTARRPLAAFLGVCHWLAVMNECVSLRHVEAGKCYCVRNIFSVRCYDALSEIWWFYDCINRVCIACFGCSRGTTLSWPERVCLCCEEQHARTS